ncbi:MAG: nucleotidyltransferase family protein [Archaeoglobaceae archaeon]
MSEKSVPWSIRARIGRFLIWLIECEKSWGDKKTFLAELRRRYGVKEIRTFGSLVRGEQRGKSDVEMLVEFEESPSLFELYGFGRLLE